MSRNSKRRTPAHARAAERAAQPGLTPRTVVLAGLGAAAIGRRRALAAIDTLAADAVEWPSRGRDAAAGAAQQLATFANQAGAQLAPLRREAEAKLATLVDQAGTLARVAEQEFTTVAAPVLAKFGLAPAPKKRATPVRARRAASRKPAAAAKSAAKPAKKAAKKSARKRPGGA